jgi:hypothetical protein
MLTDLHSSNGPSSPRVEGSDILAAYVLETMDVAVHNMGVRIEM